MSCHQEQNKALTAWSRQTEASYQARIKLGKIKPVIKMLTHLGVELPSLLENTDIALRDLAIYDARINTKQYFQLIKNACSLSPDPSFALKLGEQFYINHDGILACRLMSCQTAAHAMHLLSDYQSLLTQLFNLSFVESEEFGVFTATPIHGLNECVPYFIEYVFSSIYSLGKFCTGKTYLPMHYEFSYSGDSKQANYAHFFGSNIQFNCKENRVIIPKKILNLPFLFADQSNANVHDKICQDKVRLVQTQLPLIDQVRKQINQFKFSEATLPKVAEALYMSPRTLRRHLKQHQKSYQSILEEERKHYVRRALLRNSSIKTLAEEMGYQDTSSFSRAFKQWFGVSPNHFRGQDHSS